MSPLSVYKLSSYTPTGQFIWPYTICPLKPSLNHLEQGSVCDFNFSIGLGVSKEGVVVLNPQLLAKISERVIVKLYSIVKDEDPGDSEAVNGTFQTKFQTFFSVIVANGSTSTHLVKQSILKIRNLSCRMAMKKGPTMSNPHWANDQEALIGVHSFVDCRMTLLKR